MKTFVSSIKKCCPMQFLWPAEKGRNENGSFLAKLSGEFIMIFPYSRIMMEVVLTDLYFCSDWEWHTIYRQRFSQLSRDSWDWREHAQCFFYETRREVQIWKIVIL